jgi:hypothetical protein
MTTEQLRRVHNTRPFVPFFLHSADGRALRVNHPENLAFNGAGRTVNVVTGDESEIVDLLLIASIRFPAENDTPQNGR